MAGFDFATTYPDATIPRAQVRKLIDDPAQAFLKDSTIDAIIVRSYNTVFLQTTIDANNLTQVRDVIEALSVFHVFGAYMNSMSDNLQDTNKFEFMNKLKHYKTIAVGLGNILGIDVTGERVSIDTQEIVAGGTGLSVYSDGTYFDGAEGNV